MELAALTHDLLSMPGWLGAMGLWKVLMPRLVAPCQSAAYISDVV